MDRLTDDVMKLISGGVLPEGWQTEVNGYIKQFKTLDEHELRRVSGVEKKAEGLIALLKKHYREDESNISPADFDELCGYIRQTYK